MTSDEREDNLDLKNRGLKKHIRKSNGEYLRGKARDVGEFLRELRRLKATAKK